MGAMIRGINTTQGEYTTHTLLAQLKSVSSNQPQIKFITDINHIDILEVERTKIEQISMILEDLGNDKNCFTPSFRRYTSQIKHHINKIKFILQLNISTVIHTKYT